MLLGLLSIAALPAAVELARVSREVTLLQAAGGVPLAAGLALASILLGRAGRLRSERTLGRIGGPRLARVGHALGVLGFCIALTAALALGFFGLLTLFAS